MTNDFREQLLQYLTGFVYQQTSSNEPQFLEPRTITNNLYTYIINNSVTPAASSYKIIRGKNGNNQEINSYLLYGVNSSTNTTFMVILDYEFMPVQFIKNYSSGTNFGLFEFLIVDNDGKFYGVEKVSGTRRFVMLNNILMTTTSQYKVNLKQSYNLPVSLQTGTIKNLIKKPVGNKYLFVSTTSSYYPLAVELTVNVGATNDWVEYTNTSHYASATASWASWDENDNLTFKILGTYESEYQGSPIIYIYGYYNSSGTMAIDVNTSLGFFATPEQIQGTVINANDMYISFGETDNSGVYDVFLVKVGTPQAPAPDLIFAAYNQDVAMPGYLITSNLYNDGLNVFFSYNLPKADNTIEYHMGILVNDVFYDKNFGRLGYATSDNLYATNTFHQFNLYGYYLQLGDKLYISNSIFNNLSYNGAEYTDINELVPSSAILYNYDNEPIFARNLYNKVVRGNTTISTVEIPNTMLNEETISQENLIGETNFKLVKSAKRINKNIYEVVDINFYNMILMEDRNNVNNIIMNETGAIRLNESVSSIIDYNDCKATKIKINYDDDSSLIYNEGSYTMSIISYTDIRYIFNVYCPTNKMINNIQIISNDENTVYLTITGEFENGVIYKITQDVIIGEPFDRQVFYDGNEVYYNDEKVYY